MFQAACHPTKCDAINDVKLFLIVYRRIYCRKFLTLSNQASRYKSKCIRIPVHTHLFLFFACHDSSYITFIFLSDFCRRRYRGSFRHVTDCTRYYVCDWGFLHVCRCPQYTRFDIRIHNCNWEYFVPCDQ